MKLRNCCTGCWRAVLWPLLRHTYSEDDTFLERKRKEVIGTFIIYACVLSIVTLLSWIATDHKQDSFSTAAIILYNVVYLSLMAGLVIRKKASSGFIRCFAVLSTLVLVVADFRSSVGNEGRSWMLAVIVLDILLVCEVEYSTQNLVLGGLTLWLFIDSTERAFRFGLYDLSFLRSYETRRQPCDCERPPCEQATTAFENMSLYLFFFYLDYYFTRSFANKVLVEKRCIQASVDLAKTVAQALAAFDLVTASAALQVDSELPPELQKAFESLVFNLKTYEPYLPQSLKFTDDTLIIDTLASSSKADQEKPDSSAPSSVMTSKAEATYKIELRRKRLSVMFINIENSTATAKHSMDIFEEIHTEYLTVCLEYINARQGVLDFFEGDKVCASFGGTRTCFLHAEMAARCSSSLLCDPRLPALAELHKRTVDMNVGLASGMACCGDLGCSDVKSFTILGNVISRARLMERMCLFFKKAIVTDSAVASEIMSILEVNVLLQQIEIVRTNEVLTVFELRMEEETVPDNDEWMYQLRNATDPFNDVAIMYLNGDFGRASAILENSTDTSFANLREKLKEGSAPPKILVRYGVI